ncbi:BTB/POZ protein [Ochromonadaceae sp. CCMP2298]|nr:BTB/POZ protein [Ochromonadaceae sp. CCMP2298]
MSAPPPPPDPSESGMLKLNVAGAKFITTYSTVNNVEGMLSAMFSGRHPLTPDAEGYHFIDRDGTHFRHILNLLRSPTKFNIRLSEGDLVELEVEVDYYGLSEAYALARQIHTPVIAATSTGNGLNDRDGAAAYFTVGDLVLPASKSGWNVLVVDPKTSTVISQTCHDTEDDESEVQRCAAFLNAVPEGYIVAISVCAEESDDIGPILGAVYKLGGTSTDINDYRGVESPISFAMVGCKGWIRGVEAFDEDGGQVTATRPASTCNRW